MTDTATPPMTVKLKWSLDQLIRAFIRDPALDGISLVAKQAVPIGTMLQISVELAPGKVFKAVGQVLRVREENDGLAADVRFVSVRDDLRSWLNKQVDAFRKREQPTAALKTGHELRAAAVIEDSMDLSALNIQDGPVLGIDLGTCNSAACFMRDGQPVMVDLSDADKLGDTTLPSVVAYDDQGRVTVGKLAQDGLAKNARRTVYGAKRFIGRLYDSPAVQSMLSRFPYHIVKGQGGRVAIDVNGQPVTLTAISARILSTIRERASEHTGISFERAIITVPAYYNDNQRDAVVQAGRLAGLTVERILNEPTAAAIAYGLSHAEARKLLVYDLGGGTFDVSVMNVHNGELRVLATAGDTFLGGEDFDTLLVSYVCDTFAKKTGKQLSQNHAALAVIKDACEKAKRRLSSRDKTTISVREAMLSDRTMMRVELEVTREIFESLIEPLVSRTLKICASVLRVAKVDPTALSEVLLVGGATRIPYVKKRVAEHFEREPRCDLNPDEVVAMGAGMLAGLGASANLKDVLPMTIGVGLKGKFQPVIPANTQVPCMQSITLKIKHSELATTQLDLFQGDSAELHKNEFLGAIKLDVLTPTGSDPMPIQVDLLLSADCLLKVRLRNLENDEAHQVLLSTRD